MELSVKEKNDLIFDPLVCVRCGYCKSTCPTYLATRDERFSPRGRLILSQKLLEETSNFIEQIAIYNDLDTCSKCLECERVCPLNLRPWFNFIKVKNRTFMGKIETYLAKLLVNSKLFFGFIFSAMWRWKHRKIEENLYWDAISVSDRNAESNTGSDLHDILFFPTCFGYTVFAEERKKFQYLFRRLGVNFKVLSEKFLCCGAPLLLSGDFESFRENSRKFVLKIKKSGANLTDKVNLIVMGGTCSWIIRDFIVPDNFEELKNVEVHEAVDFLISLIDSDVLVVKKNIGKFLLHKPCHNHSQSLEKFLSKLRLDYEVTDFYCCGFGGSLFFKHKKMSDLLGVNTILRKNFDFIVSSSPGCIIQFSKFANVRHAVDLIFTIAQDL